MRIKRIVEELKKIKRNPSYLFVWIRSFHVFDNLTDEEYIKRSYKGFFGKELNLENPCTFNEKLQWLKLYDRNPQYTVMVDKYLVRDYVSKILGEEFLIPLIGMWEHPEDIDFKSLPEKFVLKCNHNSGLGMCICKNKSNLDIPMVISNLRKGLEQDYFRLNREWPYKNVPRRIIAEKYMEEEDNSDLKDYKIHCFNGKPKFILVCVDRFSSSGLKDDFYDTDWNLMQLRRPKHPNSMQGVAKPKKLEEMLYYASELSKDIPFARIDFYVINEKIYFGEITFFPASGFEKFDPEDWDFRLGKMLSIE